jgi:tRNA (guanine37-N1)-methyltransferase
MRQAALRVPLSRGEEWRRRLQEQGLLDPSLQIDTERPWIWLPLRGPPGELGPEVTLGDHEFVVQPSRGARDYRDLISLPPEQWALLPRSFDVIGDVVLIRIPSEIGELASEIGRALLEFVPGARVVGEDHGVHGESRIRELRPIAGRGPFRTRYRENGLEFVVDPSICYFSPRLAREHARVAAEVRPGERLLDLCCGLGPFCLTAARREPTLRAVAVDSNPAAIELLRENAKRLGVADRVEPHSSRVEEVLPSLGAFDRIVLNLPHEGARFLFSVATHIVPGGSLEYYEVVEKDRTAHRPSELRSLLGQGSEWSIVGDALVHEYSPGAVLRRYSFKSGPGRPE